MIKKRVHSYIRDVGFTLGNTLILAIGGYAIIGFIILFVQSGWGVNSGNTAGALLGFILGILMVTVSVKGTLGIPARFDQTTGQKKQNLKAIGTKTQLTIRWIIRYGYIPIGITTWWIFASFVGEFFFFIFGPYVIYTMVDLLVLKRSGGSETLTDKWLGTRVVET
ncbi:hypothetical protein [Bacillus sp. FJAT-27225]|uniref:hypothetical protein n=1 Tax=Bacillus sp. FJAT-27225 TaxID=1743144 RepID=UPI001112BCCE|nr:hypothetical protein [Bacillus sp. FJAT-27225]